MECSITCPTCFETFSVTGPALSEVPAQWDYDCEVCCRPMVLSFDLDGDNVYGLATIDQ
jgi:hypothetical protein